MPNFARLDVVDDVIVAVLEAVNIDLSLKQYIKCLLDLPFVTQGDTFMIGLDDPLRLNLPDGLRGDVRVFEQFKECL